MHRGLPIPRPLVVKRIHNNQNSQNQMSQSIHHPSSSSSSSVKSVLDNNINDDKDLVVARLQEATIVVNESLRLRLPTWQQVQTVVGTTPRIVVVGLPPSSQSQQQEDPCQVYQHRVPPIRRMMGAAGMFNTGTNLVTTLLKQNCQIPELVLAYGPNATKEAHVRVCNTLLSSLFCV
jgi:hypothetical protein